ncbi:MAG: hypothetical protein BWY57_03469 [Betaproteobacteria bacterium ADurb.Bin341]|nr:MAG: hypothetical protein BWY57_03469 [Betaproteobacteria bacterium ADurb.Bin341]
MALLFVGQLNGCEEVIHQGLDLLLVCKRMVQAPKLSHINHGHPVAQDLLRLLVVLSCFPVEEVLAGPRGSVLGLNPRLVGLRLGLGGVVAAVPLQNGVFLRIEAYGAILVEFWREIGQVPGLGSALGDLSIVLERSADVHGDFLSETSAKTGDTLVTVFCPNGA